MATIPVLTAGATAYPTSKFPSTLSTVNGAGGGAIVMSPSV